jgi:antitoxin component YwqK of YwqJK toxin-antitoxin module
MRFLAFTMIVFLGLLNCHAQNDTINQLDQQGRKQGYWEKRLPDGNLIYQGYFKDNKPVGEMRRYYESGEIKAIRYYKEDSDWSRAKIFYNNGEMASEGTYYLNLKDSTWTNYSFYSGSVTSVEQYNKGMKQGVEKKFYENGKISEEIEWNMNVKHGKWRQYFNDGATKLIANYSFGKVSGLYIFYWPNGNQYIKGQFIDNKRHGKWFFYKDNGELKTEIVYHYGKAENEEEIIEKDQEFFRMVEENMGKFEEPTLEDVMPSSRDFY